MTGHEEKVNNQRKISEIVLKFANISIKQLLQLKKVIIDISRNNSPSPYINLKETGDNLSKDLGTENAFGVLVKVSLSIAQHFVKHFCSVM